MKRLALAKEASVAPPGRCDEAGDRTARDLLIVLAGNPGSGKTALFHALTGAKRHAGNRFGTKMKTGRVACNGYAIGVVDLPETYSLTASFGDEALVRDFIIEEKPDAVVQVVGATDLEQGLYLTTQLVELEVPVVVVLNTADGEGDAVDRARLSAFLEIPIVYMTGMRDEEPAVLLDTVIEEVEASSQHERIVDYVDYGEGLEAMIASLVDALAADTALHGRYPLRWLAVKLLEGDEDAVSKVRKSPVHACVQALLASPGTDDGHEIFMVEKRYETVAAIYLQVRCCDTGLPPPAEHTGDALYRCPGSSCCCGDAESEGIVVYTLTEKGKRFAEKLAGLGGFAGTRG